MMGSTSYDAAMAIFRKVPSFQKNRKAPRATMWSTPRTVNIGSVVFSRVKVSQTSICCPSCDALPGFAISSKGDPRGGPDGLAR